MREKLRATALKHAPKIENIDADDIVDRVN